LVLTKDLGSGQLREVHLARQNKLPVHILLNLFDDATSLTGIELATGYRYVPGEALAAVEQIGTRKPAEARKWPWS
jgi:hypothetical protein